MRLTVNCASDPKATCVLLTWRIDSMATRRVCIRRRRVFHQGVAVRCARRGRGEGASRDEFRQRTRCRSCFRRREARMWVLLYRAKATKVRPRDRVSASAVPRRDLEKTKLLVTLPAAKKKYCRTEEPWLARAAARPDLCARNGRDVWHRTATGTADAMRAAPLSVHDRVRPSHEDGAAPRRRRAVRVAAELAAAFASRRRGRECRRAQRLSSERKERRVTVVPRGDAIVDHCLAVLRGAGGAEQPREMNCAPWRSACSRSLAGPARPSCSTGARPSARCAAGRTSASSTASSRRRGRARPTASRCSCRSRPCAPGSRRLRRCSRATAWTAWTTRASRASTKRASAARCGNPKTPGRSAASRARTSCAPSTCAAYEAFDFVDDQGDELERASLRHAVSAILGHATLDEASKYASFQVRGLRRRLDTFDLRASADGA